MTTEREQNLEDALERARYHISELEQQLRATKREASKAEEAAASLAWKAKEHDRVEAARSRYVPDPFNAEDSIRLLLDDWDVPQAKEQVDRIEAVLVEREELRAKVAALEAKP